MELKYDLTRLSIFYIMLKKMISIIFLLVAFVFYFVSLVTGLSYEEVNVIFYFFLIPFSWCAMLDIIFKFKFFRISFAILFLTFAYSIQSFQVFSNNLFEYCFQYLDSFSPFLTYSESSVFICVFLPALVYLFLIPFLVLSVRTVSSPYFLCLSPKWEGLLPQ